jgi:hypothetical protein
MLLPVVPPLGRDVGPRATNNADYRIEPNATIVVLLSERAIQRGAGARPERGSRLAFRTRHDTAEFVRVGEAEGFVFEGKEFL